MNPEEGQLVETANDERYGHALQRLRSAKTLSDSRIQHQCSHQRCSPESEPQLISQGLLEGPPVSNNIFLCELGAVHICSEAACQLFGTTHNQTCHISGMQFGSVTSTYDSNDPRTWYSKPDPGAGVTLSAAVSVLSKTKKRRRLELAPPTPTLPPPPPPPQRPAQKVLSEAAGKEKARDLVIQLLFSTARASLNTTARIGFAQNAAKAKQTYITQRLANRQLPYLTDIMRLMGNYTAQPPPLLEFELDDALVTYYSCVIWQVWTNVVLKYYSAPGGDERIDFEMVALAILYDMRQGIARDNRVLLPLDQFLLCNLPNVNDLRHFGYNRKKVTQGSEILSNTYYNAFQAGALIESVMLSVDDLPEKGAISHFKKLGE